MSEIDLTPRERVTRAVNRRNPVRIPREAGFTPGIQKLFEQHTGETDPESYFEMETRGVGLATRAEKGDFSRYHPDLPENASIDYYGIGHVPGDFHHFTSFRHPLAKVETLAELEEYPWPDPSLSEHQSLESRVNSVQSKGLFAKSFAGHIFETAWQMTGFDRLFQWVVDKPEMAAYLLDRITQNNVFTARRFAEAGVDMVQVGDDVAMQDRMMMSPALWREILKPRLARVIRAARDVNPGIPIWYHSDGAITPIVEDLIEVGVTVLNPVQPECVDLRDLKTRFGDRLAFWGTIGTQTVMPFGTPGDVKRCVKEMIGIFAPGLLIAPTHVLEPDVPWENIVAMFEAVDEFGRL